MTQPLDSSFEDELARDPYSLSCWLRYLDYKRTASAAAQTSLHERAVAALPGSYKLWKRYLDFRVASLSPGGAGVCSPEAGQSVVLCFERALVLLHRMPVLWTDYLAFMAVRMPFVVSQTRRCFDRALRCLPPSQHDHIWPLYLRFARRVGGPTAARIHMRHLQYSPGSVEEAVEVLVESGCLQQAAALLVDCINAAANVHGAALSVQPPRGTSAFGLWSRLCDLIEAHPAAFPSLRVDDILRAGIARFPDQAARLWNILALYWIGQGSPEQARDVFEEALALATNVADFGLVFDAYVEFEEASVAALIEASSNEAGGGSPQLEASLEIELRMMRLERLVSRLPLMKSDVVLWQHPNSVTEWLRRCDLLRTMAPNAPSATATATVNADMDVNVNANVNANGGIVGGIVGDDISDAVYTDAVHTDTVRTFERAVGTVDPMAATGDYAQLWIRYAQHLAGRGDADAACSVYERAVAVRTKTASTLADIWAAYAEFHIGAGRYQCALDVLQRATRVPDADAIGSAGGGSVADVSFADHALPPQARVFKSVRLWSQRIDLAEALLSPAHVAECYEHMIQLRIATAQTFHDYAALCERLERHEDSYQVYERAIRTFGQAAACEFWMARFEEQHGGVSGARNAVAVLSRWCGAAAYGQRERAFEQLLLAAERLLVPADPAASRPYFEQAFAGLPGPAARKIAARYALVETGLGQYERARTLFRHGAALATCSGSRGDDSDGLWSHWEALETAHGTPATYADFARARKAASAQAETESDMLVRTAYQARQAALQ
ncbi:TPR-like protein, partial [Ramicandelaber brevisporus]